MRNAIKEYVEYSGEDKKNIWNSATFVFDTNVFLNLYRYSNNTRDQLIKALESLTPRIWMPYQVALEFCKDRYKVINEVNKRFEKLGEEANSLIKTWRNELHLDKNDQDMEQLCAYLKDWMDKKKENSYRYFDTINDDIFNTLLELFDGKTGKAFSSEEIVKIEKEGDKRFDDKTPPGYKDHNKRDNKYGDLLVWKEILCYAKSNQEDIIFVTQDQKEDWWNIQFGKTIGPRIELRKEFNEETGKMFHMYSMTSFLSYAAGFESTFIDKTTIDEVELFNSVMKKKASRMELKEYFDSLDNKSERTAARIRFKIANIERKNKKRRYSISTLSHKEKQGKLTQGEKIALQRNQENLISGENQLELLKTQLMEMTDL